MNAKMTEVANVVGNFITQHYSEALLSNLFSSGLCIEDVIFHYLIQCCRCAYLRTSEKHPIKYYLEEDEYDCEDDKARKRIQHVFEYVKDHFDYLDKIHQSNNSEFGRPQLDLVKRENNRYPSYNISAFQYWEACNIRDMKLVKAIVECRIGSSHKVSIDDFEEIAKQYDAFMLAQRDVAQKGEESMVLASIKAFTLQTKYAFDFYYEIAAEMEKENVTEFPAFKNRIMLTSGNYKAVSVLPMLFPDCVADEDCVIRYPMILQRRRFVHGIVTGTEGTGIDHALSSVMAANILSNAILSHMSLCGKFSFDWFEENTNIADWASVFETYDVFRTFIPDKVWTGKRIKYVRKIYDSVSIDYKKKLPVLSP